METKQSTKLHLVLLDWEIAFDEVDRAGLLQAMHRLGVDSKLVRRVQMLYKRTQFRASKHRWQHIQFPIGNTKRPVSDKDAHYVHMVPMLNENKKGNLLNSLGCMLNRRGNIQKRATETDQQCSHNDEEARSILVAAHQLPSNF